MMISILVFNLVLVQVLGGAGQVIGTNSPIYYSLTSVEQSCL